MNTVELYTLTDWIETEIINSAILDKYHALHHILQQHVTSDQPRQSFSAQRDELLQALAAVRLEVLSGDQVRFLQRLGVADTVGERGVERIEDCLYKNVIDVATSAAAIGAMLGELQQGVERSRQIAGGLQGLTLSADDDMPGDVMMRVVFAGDAAMANVADFKRWGELWNDIGYGIAFANNETIEDVHIVGAASGSVVLELGVSRCFAQTAGDIILSALLLTEKVQDINRKAEELRRLQLKNNKLVLDLEKEAEFEIRTGVDNISDQMIRKLGLKKNGEGDKITALMKAVRHLMHFLEQGGEVDFVIPFAADASADDPFTALRQLSLHIRELKKKLPDDNSLAGETRAA